MEKQARWGQMNDTTRALRRQGLSCVTYCVVPTAGDMTRILARKRAGTNPAEKRILGHRHKTIVEVRRIHEARKRAGPAPLGGATAYNADIVTHAPKLILFCPVPSKVPVPSKSAGKPHLRPRTDRGPNDTTSGLADPFPISAHVLNSQTVMTKAPADEMTLQLVNLGCPMARGAKNVQFI